MANKTDYPQVQINLPMDKISEFCQRWQITEFALFGSVLRDDFRPDSDIDVLIKFATEASHDRESMSRELESLFNRKVHLVYRRVIERDSNYLLRKSILGSAQVIYAT